MSNRIKKFLQQDIFKEEFSHTILHKQQVVFSDPENLSKPVVKKEPKPPATERKQEKAYSDLPL